eukprot:2727441-Rhodomonas_salina.1
MSSTLGYTAPDGDGLRGSIERKKSLEMEGPKWSPRRLSAIGGYQPRTDNLLNKLSTPHLTPRNPTIYSS